MSGFLPPLQRVLRHLWHALRDPARRAFSPALRAHLEQQVAASEARHSGQIRICAESSLPFSYLRRNAPCRQRALMLFGKLRIWDTEDNNGVLIYLLMAERTIEIVADRGLNRHVSPQEWQQVAGRLGQALHDGHWEQGLRQALEETTALLVRHYPAAPGAARCNELDDAPILP